MLAEFDALRCADPPSGVPAGDRLVTCDTDGVEYALRPAALTGRVLEASASPEPTGGAWGVDLRLDDQGAEALADLSARLARTGQQAALVVDDEVVAAPTFASPVPDGRLRLSAGYTEAEAEELADRLRA